MKKLIIFFALIHFYQLKAQDLHFSQFYLSPVYFNPAYSGALRDIDLAIQYKGQWGLIDKGYRTIGSSANFRIPKKHSNGSFWSTGFNSFYDISGTNNFSSLRVNVPVCYTVLLNSKNTLSNAVAVGFGQNALRNTNLSWGSQYNGQSYDPSLPTYETLTDLQFSFFDISYGMAWNYNYEEKTVADIRGFKNTLGISISHLNKPNYSLFANDEEKLDMKYVLFETAHISIKNSRLSFLPSLIYQHQGGHNEIVFGTLARVEIEPISRYTGFHKGSAISMGGFLRARDAFIVASQLEYSNFVFGMSYDLNISALKSTTTLRGGLEFCIKYVNPSPFKKVSTKLL